jgi:hypothetical protein
MLSLVLGMTVPLRVLDARITACHYQLDFGNLTRHDEAMMRLVLANNQRARYKILEGIP